MHNNVDIVPLSCTLQNWYILCYVYFVMVKTFNKRSMLLQRMVVIVRGAAQVGKKAQESP